MGILFTMVLLAFVACNVVWSVFVRKLAKTRIASICSIASVVIAFVGTLLARDYVTDPAFFENVLMPYLAPSLPEAIVEMFDFSITLRETIIGLPVALIAPLVFVVLYLVAKLLTGIVYFIILLFAGRTLRKKSKNNLPYAQARTIAWSTVAGLLTLVVVLLPVAFYGGMAAGIVEFAAGADWVGENTGDDLSNAAENYITPVTESAIVQSFRALGGDAMLAELTTFNLNGELIFASDEVENLLDMASGVAPLLGADFKNLSDEDADKLVGVVDTLPNSKFLTAIVAEAIYFFTDDIVNGNEPLSLDESGMFDNLINRVVDVLHDDAEAAVRPTEGMDASANMDKFTADLRTVAELAGVILKSGVLSNTGDTEVLLDELANGTTIKDMILTLGKNDSLKCLIPEVTNIGIRAIASFMEVQSDATVIYDELMSTIAADLNSVKSLDDAAKVSTLSPKLNKAFDHAGIVIDKQVLNLYSVAMIQGIVKDAGNDEITPADVQEFFVIYAWSADQYKSDVALLIEDDRETTAPAILANMILDLSSLKNAKSETFQDDVAAILATYGEAMLGTTEGALYEAVVGVTIKKVIDSSATEKTPYNTSVNTASLQSAEEMKKTTFLKTLDILLIDIDEASQKINNETLEGEANTIASIFGCAGDLMNDVSGEVNISTMATSVGDILNAFNRSVCVGETRTSNLFVAIIQSSLVRDAANMDIFTATDLGNKGSGGDYAKTFKTISNTMDVLANVNSAEGMSKDDLSTMLQDMTPETAGMIGSYVTEERLNEEWGLGEEESATAAPIISDVFSYMGEANMTEEESKKEAEALNDVMNLANSATANAEEGTKQTVFGGEDSVMGKDAAGTVETFMSSESVKHSLNNNAESLEDDAFGMQESMAEKEKEDLKNAMKNYYANTEYENEEDKAADKEALTNFGKLFGFSNEEIGNLFSEEPVNP